MNGKFDGYGIVNNKGHIKYFGVTKYKFAPYLVVEVEKTRYKFSGQQTKRMLMGDRSLAEKIAATIAISIKMYLEASITEFLVGRCKHILVATTGGVFCVDLDQCTIFLSNSVDLTDKPRIYFSGPNIAKYVVSKSLQYELLGPSIKKNPIELTSDLFKEEQPKPVPKVEPVVIKEDILQQEDLMKDIYKNIRNCSFTEEQLKDMISMAETALKYGSFSF